MQVNLDMQIYNSLINQLINGVPSDDPFPCKAFNS